MRARKNMYSLMLSEDVVAMIDRLAYQKKSNRSNMINQILAEYVSYRTPEMRLREIFGQMERALCTEDGFQRMDASSDSVFSLRSALTYKYNPSVRYTVELYKSDELPELGRLRVSLRTQNAALILYLQQFYRLWMTLEGESDGQAAPHSIDGDRLTRTLRLQADRELHGEVAVGELIARYVDVFDRALKLYFEHLDEPETAKEGIGWLIEQYREQNPVRV